MTPAEILILVVAALILYFLQSVIAYGNRNPDRNSVFIINLWLGWTIIGWITAFGWAFDRRR